MKAADWIDRVKRVKGWPSDYRVAKELQLSRQAVSDYRTRTQSMDEETAIKVACLLGLPPAGVVVDQVAERTHSPEVQSALRDIANRLCILCKVANLRVLSLMVL